MTPTPEVQERIRRYLLGQLADGARAEIEQDILASDDLFEELLVVEDEIIDEYLAGKLSAEARASFEGHFLATPERHEKLKFGSAFDRYLSTPANLVSVREQEPSRKQWVWTQAFRSSPVRIAACAIVFVVIALGVWRVFFHQSEVDKGLLALNAAYREQRPVEARISNLDYAPFPQTRGPGQPESVDALARDRAELTLNNAVNERRDAAAHHALGKVYLAKKDFDRAIEQFDEALKSDQKNAQLYSDLGAAWLEKGKIDIDRARPDSRDQSGGQGFEELARGLENIKRAIELNPTLLEALFNRALGEQRLFLLTEAEADWQAYLKKDPNSRWSEEARENLRAIEKHKVKTQQRPDAVLQDFLSSYGSRDQERAWGLLRENRDFSGSVIENLLVDRYLDAAERKAEAEEALGALTFAADLEVQRANDHSLFELLRYLRGPAQLSLTEARQLVKSGYHQLIDFQPESAIKNYTRAKQLFDQIGDRVESLYAKYALGHAYLLLHKSEPSLETFEGVARTARARQYWWLLAQALNATANVEIGLNDYSAALKHSTQSMEISERIDDVGGMMKTADQLAVEYARFGNYQQSLSYELRALVSMHEHSATPLQLWRSYFLIATPLNRLGLNEAAVSFQKEALRIAVDSHIPYGVCRSYVVLGLLYGDQDQFAEATKSVQSGLELTKHISSEATRLDTQVYASLQLGHVYRRAGDFTRALGAYDYVLQVHDQLKYQAFIYASHKGRLLSYLARGDHAAAEAELQTTLKLFEEYRGKISEESNRDSFFDAEQNVYDLAIDFEYSAKNDPAQAWEYAERSRARSLLDIITTETHTVANRFAPDIAFTSVSQPMSLAEIQRRMPEESQLLQYAIVDKKLICWLLSRSKVTWHEQDVDSRELSEEIQRYVQLISRPSENSDDEAARLARRLYSVLIEPVRTSLVPGKELCIVPDKTLNYLPFAALISPVTGAYLIQETTLTLAPSSTMFVVCSENGRLRERLDSERLLSVGNPKLGEGVSRDFADLPASEYEANEIASFYRPAVVLTERAATKTRLIGEMEKADVIHLAVHADVNSSFHMESRLLLADEAQTGSNLLNDATDGLQTHEIYGLRFPRTRLVVLSACRTGAERYYQGEGMISIARPFTARGVPLVVASLWPVDSAATAELMISFHRHRKVDHLSTAQALRAAQSDMLVPNNRHNQPYYWASFFPIGGQVQF